MAIFQVIERYAVGNLNRQAGDMGDVSASPIMPAPTPAVWQMTITDRPRSYVTIVAGCYRHLLTAGVIAALYALCTRPHPGEQTMPCRRRG